MKRMRNCIILALVLLLLVHVVWPAISALAPILIVLLLLVVLYRRTS
jgi:hypothetical protein